MAAFQEFPRFVLQLFTTKIQNSNHLTPRRVQNCLTMTAAGTPLNLRKHVAAAMKDTQELLCVIPMLFSKESELNSSRNSAITSQPASAGSGEVEVEPTNPPAGASQATTNQDTDKISGSSASRAQRQKIKDLFSDDDLKLVQDVWNNQDVSVSRDGLFSNGDTVHFDEYVKTVVETKKKKEEARQLFENIDYKPSYGLIVAAVICFGKRDTRHFFWDGLYVLLIFAQEMGVHLCDYLNLRGWLAVRRGKDVEVSYRRARKCLQAFSIHQVVSYYRLSAIMENLFHVLESRVVTPPMPFYAESEKEKKRREKKIEKQLVQKKLKERGRGESMIGTFVCSSTCTNLISMPHSFLFVPR